MYSQRYDRRLGSNILTIIFQRTLAYGEVPTDWRSANVTAIFKKGDRFKASNYRPVSLTSLCCKLQEHILVSNIMNHLEPEDIDRLSAWLQSPSKLRDTTTNDLVPPIRHVRKHHSLAFQTPFANTDILQEQFLSPDYKRLEFTYRFSIFCC